MLMFRHGTARLETPSAGAFTLAVGVMPEAVVGQRIDHVEWYGCVTERASIVGYAEKIRRGCCESLAHWLTL
jgi:hypothetical protein